MSKHTITLTLTKSEEKDLRREVHNTLLDAIVDYNNADITFAKLAKYPEVKEALADIDEEVLYQDAVKRGLKTISDNADLFGDVSDAIDYGESPVIAKAIEKLTQNQKISDALDGFNEKHRLDELKRLANKLGYNIVKQ